MRAVVTLFLFAWRCNVLPFQFAFQHIQFVRTFQFHGYGPRANVGSLCRFSVKSWVVVGHGAGFRYFHPR